MIEKIWGKNLVTYWFKPWSPKPLYIKCSVPKHYRQTGQTGQLIAIVY